MFFVFLFFVSLQDGETPLDILRQESDYEEETERRQKCLQLLQVNSSVRVYSFSEPIYHKDFTMNTQTYNYSCTDSRNHFRLTYE